MRVIKFEMLATKDEDNHRSKHDMGLLHGGSHYYEGKW
jgi:hypothetical protein